MANRPRAATIYLAMHGGQFALQVGGAESERRAAAAVKPLARRSVNFSGFAVVSVAIAPSHPAFPVFGSISRCGRAVLPRADFAPLDDSLDAALRGELDITGAHELFEQIVTVASKRLSPAKPLDPRVNAIVALLRENTNFPLDALAAAAHLSYFWMSHAFSQNIGLPLRSYQSWQRLSKAVRFLLRGHSIATAVRAAGFIDASHLSRACREEYGVNPTFFRGKRAEVLYQVSEDPPLQPVSFEFS